MESASEYGNGPASHVVAGVVNVLDISRDEEAAPKMRSIKTLDDFFRAVG